MLLLYIYHYRISVYIIKSENERSLKSSLCACPFGAESTWLPATRGGWYRRVRLGPKLGQISSKWDKSGTFFWQWQFFWEKCQVFGNFFDIQMAIIRRIRCQLGPTGGLTEWGKHGRRRLGFWTIKIIITHSGRIWHDWFCLK